MASTFVTRDEGEHGGARPPSRDSSLSSADDHPIIAPESATLYLLKKAASGIFPRAAGVFFGDIVRDPSANPFWDHGDSKSATTRGESVAHSFAFDVATQVLLLYLRSALGVLLPADGGFGFGDECGFTYDYPHKEPSLPCGAFPACDADPTKPEEDERCRGGTGKSAEPDCLGEIPSSRRHEFSAAIESEGDNEERRLDYIITQIDVSRMSREASRRLDVESVYRLPTIVYRRADEDESSGMHPSAGSGDESVRGIDVSASLSSSEDRDCTFPWSEAKGDGEEQGREYRRREASPQRWSWMVVPSDPSEEDLTRMPPLAAGASSTAEDKYSSVPGSIYAIHQSNDRPRSTTVGSSAAARDREHEADREREEFETCILCRENFRDGERLRVLPCRHRFHCGCIDGSGWPPSMSPPSSPSLSTLSWPQSPLPSLTLSPQSMSLSSGPPSASHFSDDEGNHRQFARGCPTCRNKQTTVTDAGAGRSCTEKTLPEDEQRDSRGPAADGSVPPWAFARLGDLLSRT